MPLTPSKGDEKEHMDASAIMLPVVLPRVASSTIKESEQQKNCQRWFIQVTE